MQYTREKLRTERETGGVSCSTRRVEFTKVNGSKTEDMAKAMRGTLITIGTKETSLMGKPTVREFILGRMGKYMTGNGEMESKKDMAFGKLFPGIHTLENGNRAKLKAMGFICGGTAIDTRENGLDA
jgi:hypothetical protein